MNTHLFVHFAVEFFAAKKHPQPAGDFSQPVHFVLAFCLSTFN
ncbi:MAG: hypothetical protein ACRD37_03775 [Candidatus Acidiferrales bacterium]